MEYERVVSRTWRTSLKEFEEETLYELSTRALHPAYNNHSTFGLYARSVSTALFYPPSINPQEFGSCELIKRGKWSG